MCCKNVGKCIQCKAVAQEVHARVKFERGGLNIIPRAADDNNT